MKIWIYVLGILCLPVSQRLQYFWHLLCTNSFEQSALAAAHQVTSFLQLSSENGGCSNEFISSNLHSLLILLLHILNNVRLIVSDELTASQARFGAKVSNEFIGFSSKWPFTTFSGFRISYGYSKLRSTLIFQICTR